MAHNSQSVQEWLGYLTVDQVKALKILAQSLPDNPIVINIGAGGGTSGLAFKESRPDLTLYTIDIQEESSPFGCLQGERVVMESAGFVLGQGWHQIHADSKKVGKEWPNYNGFPKMVDMVFVDGDHTREGCEGDILIWMPHIKPGGIIAIHDYGNVQFPFDDVNQVVDELLLRKYKTILRVDTLIAFQL